jgi:N-methylhydantoinase A
LRLGVDIGGTFTDVVVFDEDAQSIRLAKALSTPSELARGVEESIVKTGVPLAEADLLIHGSTIVVNAVVERRGARTALVTTEGFRDTYEIGRINRPESFNLRFRKHKPLVPRELVLEVPERVRADGSVWKPLDEAAAREVAAYLRDEGIESVAVLFLHSYKAPEHETRMREILLEANPDFYVTVSHELSREYREYERTSTTAANAYIGPIVSRYLNDLEGRLDRHGFEGNLLIMQSNGGLEDVATARLQCIQMMESGPAGGVVGTMALCEALGLESAIAFDMGGTTAKSCVVRRGVPSLSPDYFFGGYNEGLAIRIPVLEIIEVGTGGGSVAWFDEGGGLHVGPLSAGAEPGPVCYGLGGSEPTVTDANVILGRLSPDQFLGGEMQLDREAAAIALEEKVARPLGVTLERAAAGMLEIATVSMANSVRGVTIEQGLDPRDFTLVAYGGGGPLHAAAVARELSIGTVVIPQHPGHFSAFGMLMADLRRDFVQTLLRRLRDLDMDDLEAEFQKLEAEGRHALEASGGAGGQIVFERSADMRYVGQEHSVAVKLPANVAGEAMRAEVKALFDAAHQQRYSHSARDEAADVVSLRVTAIGRLGKPDLPRIGAGESTPPSGARAGSRLVTFDESHGPIATAVYSRDGLLAGNVIDGPAVVQEAASITLIAPGDRARVNEYGHIVLTIGGAS